MTIEDYDLLTGAIDSLANELQDERLEEIETGSISFEKDGFEFDIFEDEAIISGISQPTSNIIIPDFVEYNDKKYKVTCINHVFIGDEYEKLTIGKNVKYIRSDCFSGCKMLQEVKLNNCLEVIGESAFSRTPIDEVIIPESIKRLDDNAFFECEYLTVYLPKRLQAGANISFGETLPLVERVFHHVAFIHYYDESDIITDNMELLPLKRMQDIFDSCSHSALDIIRTYMNLSNQNWDSNQSYYMGHPDMRAKRYEIRKSTNEEIFDDDNDPIIATYKSMKEVLLDGWKLDSVIKKKNYY